MGVKASEVLVGVKSPSIGVEVTDASVVDIGEDVAIEEAGVWEAPKILEPGVS